MANDDAVLSALDAVVAAVRENAVRGEHLVKRANEIKQERAAGRPWREIVSEDKRPLVVELLTQNITALTTAGADLRRMEAEALHAEGLSMERIAQLFGVTRQRISELLRQVRHPAQH